MYKFSSKAIAILLIAGVTFSCDDQQELAPKKKSLDELTAKVLSSRQFSELDVDLNDLDQSAKSFSDATEKAIVIPFKGHDGRKLVMAILNEKQQLRKVFTFEQTGDIAPEQVFEKMVANQFNGSFKFGDRSGIFQVDLKNSKIVSNSVFKSIQAKAFEPECGEWTSTTGPLACFGARLEQMNVIDKAACYIGFGVCFAQGVASCILDDCVVNPEPDQE